MSLVFVFTSSKESLEIISKWQISLQKNPNESNSHLNFSEQIVDPFGSFWIVLQICPQFRDYVLKGLRFCEDRNYVNNIIVIQTIQ